MADGCAGSPIWVRTRSAGAASVTKAMLRMSAAQLGQVSGSDSNSRANNIAQSWRAGERAFGAEALDGALSAVESASRRVSAIGGLCRITGVGCCVSIATRPACRVLDPQGQQSA